MHHQALHTSEIGTKLDPVTFFGSGFKTDQDSVLWYGVYRM